MNDEERAWSEAIDTSRWNSLSPDEVDSQVMSACFRYAFQPSAERIADLDRVYRRYMEVAPAKRRLALCQAMAEPIEDGDGVGTMAFLPILHLDNEHAVVSSAALNIVSLMPRENGDPLTGFKVLANRILAGRAQGAQEGSMASALLLLGDRRVLPLLQAVWRSLDRAGRRRLASAWSGFTSALHVDFLVDALEEEQDDAVFGSLAGTLSRMPAHSVNGNVVEVERNLPASSQNKNPIRILRTWSFEEYGQRIMPRLKAIHARESEPKILGVVIDYWS